MIAQGACLIFVHVSNHQFHSYVRLIYVFQTTENYDDSCFVIDKYSSSLFDFFFLLIAYFVEYKISIIPLVYGYLPRTKVNFSLQVMVVSYDPHSSIMHAVLPSNLNLSSGSAYFGKVREYL